MRTKLSDDQGAFGGSSRGGPPNGIVPDIEALRAGARERIENGTLTDADAYPASVADELEILQKSLAMEIVCWLRYSQHALVANGIRAEIVAAEFREHADAELAHAKRLGDRIVQLGGEPDLAPTTLVASPAKYTRGGDLRVMILDNLIEERVAIEWYRSAIASVGPHDATTRRLFESILEEEEEHAEDLSSFLRGKEVLGRA
jgi:bacterioferritin